MVRALLDGRKTQTRRLFNPRGFEFYTHPDSGDRYTSYRPYRDGTWDESRWTGGGAMASFGWGDGLYSYLPYAPGDRLWVKETWGCHFATDDQKPSEIDADLWSVRYFADDHIRPASRDGSLALLNQCSKKRVAIFMPRWASRLTLVVNDVRVERLQAISRADAIAEGLSLASSVIEEFWRWPEPYHKNLWLSPPAAYRHLWNAINGADAWESNPWVAAITFTVEPEGA